MGEAKRRKKLDPNYGKKPDGSSRFSITTSELTGNWLIMIDGDFCYDSAMKLPDAEKVLTQVIEYEKTHPLPPTYRRISTQQYLDWTVKSVGFIDDVPALTIGVPLDEFLNNDLSNIDLTNTKKFVLDPNCPQLNHITTNSLNH
ncbi:DUF2839 domain-containing protein [Laspinema olomoucense]|uniref:DUF2839 domain-containing protein n=1 Tax=Laspinema olomoucense TaxID=3231600 RepID=UPI0021BB601B|nr:DUF2839 domain-containing protein [Laspinema sp. D3d]MCT7971175.1 DUF2839 domain-containing protein [Laspinema sp. D3d]